MPRSANISEQRISASRIPELSGTSLGTRLETLTSVYAEIAQAQNEFLASATEHQARTSCPSGCGLCCANFTPDILPAEAELLAFFLLTEKPELAEKVQSLDSVAKSSSTCPFWDPSKPGQNCMVYPARPLICRLFGFSSVRTKKQEPQFSLCKHMHAIPGIRERRFTGAAIMEQTFGAIPPAMADYTMKLIAEFPQEASQRELLPQTVRKALMRVGLILSFSDKAAS